MEISEGPPIEYTQQQLRNQVTQAHTFLQDTLTRRQQASHETITAFNKSIAQFTESKWRPIRQGQTSTLIYPYAATDLFTPLAFKPNIFITFDQRDPYQNLDNENFNSTPLEKYIEHRTRLGWIENDVPISVQTWAIDAALSGIQPDGIAFKGQESISLGENKTASATTFLYTLPDGKQVQHVNLGGVTIPEIVLTDHMSHEDYMKHLLDTIEGYTKGDLMILDKGARFNDISSFVADTSSSLLVTDDNTGSKHISYKELLEPLATDAEKDEVWKQMEDKTGMVVNFGYAEIPEQFGIYRVSSK